MYVITFEFDVVDTQVDSVRRFLMSSGAAEVVPISSGGRQLVTYTDPAGLVSTEAVRSLPGVSGVAGTETKNRLVASASRPKNLDSGARGLTVIAGPCGIESEEQVATIFSFLAGAGLRFVRAGAYKPRTSPHDYQGPGIDGLAMAHDVASRYGLQIVTEIVDPRDLDRALPFLSVIQIGTRSMQNFPLLRAAGQSGRPILLKRGMSATVEEWIGAAEHALVAGAETVIFCERGIRTFENATRNTLDLLGAVALKERTDLPVIVDPSHAAGRRSLVSAGARAAVAAGLDGLIVEVHNDPASARSDAAQALPLDDFSDLLDQVRSLAGIVERPTAESDGGGG